MTDDQLIARQAKQIEELKDQLSDLQERIQSAISIMVCIGGPLNDNRLGYNSEQRKLFHETQHTLENKALPDNDLQIQHGTFGQLPPFEIMKAAQDVEHWFKERNISGWFLGGIQERQ